MEHQTAAPFPPAPQDGDSPSEALVGDRQGVDLVDEQRSEDDGMPDHADEAPAEIEVRPLASVLKRQTLAAEYSARAFQASAQAAASVLDRVREKHEAAAERWRLLAALNERDRRSEPSAAPVKLYPVA